MTIIVHDDGFYTTTNNADDLQDTHGFFFHHFTSRCWTRLV